MRILLRNLDQCNRVLHLDLFFPREIYDHWGRIWHSFSGGHIWTGKCTHPAHYQFHLSADNLSYSWSVYPGHQRCNALANSPVQRGLL